MGDPRRFNLFADLIKSILPPQFVIADAAAGKGILNLALRERGFNNVLSIDKRYHHYPVNYKYGYFTQDYPIKVDAVVAMHPDQATDHVISYCSKNQVVGIICPCCIKPSASTFNSNYKYNDWLSHLIGFAKAEKGLRVERARLKMNGRNDVLIVSP